jgi:hypothetical protein
MKSPINWPAGFAAAALFLGLQSIVGPSDIEAAADAAMAYDDAVIDARIEAMSQSEAERRAWAVCRGWHAERAVVLRLEDTGEFVCRRRGEVL